MSSTQLAKRSIAGGLIAAAIAIPATAQARFDQNPVFFPHPAAAVCAIAEPHEDRRGATPCAMSRPGSPTAANAVSTPGAPTCSRAAPGSSATSGAGTRPRHPTGSAPRAHGGGSAARTRPPSRSPPATRGALRQSVEEDIGC